MILLTDYFCDSLLLLLNHTLLREKFSIRT
jgi:hypothetical protein